jgi:TolA-binding protein
MEMDKKEDAAEHYLKAAKLSPNKFTTPIYLMKAGMAYEEMKKYDNAVKVYEQVKLDYSESTEGREIEKYLARAKALEGK